jgi:hypothetical protein
MPEFILVQPDGVGILGDEFVDGQAFNQVRSRNPLLFAINEDRHELPLSSENEARQLKSHKQSTMIFMGCGCPQGA